MIDKAKDIMIIIGAIGVAILAYILSQKDKKIGELYYQAKSEAYKVKIEELEVKHDQANDTTISNTGRYLDLRRKYEESKRKSG